MIYAVEITLAIDASGTVVTRYFSTAGFTTRPTDNPANTHFEARVLDPGNIRRSMFSKGMIGGAIRPDYGDLVLSNGDGALDDWINYSVYARAITIRAHDNGAAAYPSGWTTVLATTMYSIAVDLKTVRVQFRDRLIEFDKPMCAGRFAGTGAEEGPSDLAGSRKPRGYYDITFAPGLLVDASRKLYWISETPSAVALTAYVGLAQLTMGSPYTTLADCLATAPSAGQARAYVGGPTLVRLGTAPGYDVAVGGFSGMTMDHALPYGLNLMGEIGVSDVILDGSPLVNAYRDGTEDTWLEMLETTARGSQAWFGFDRTGRLRWNQIVEPSASSSIAILTEADVISAEHITGPDTTLPAWRVAAYANRNWAYGTQLDPVGSAAMVTANPWMRNKYRNTAVAANGAILAKYPFALDLTIETEMSASASIVANGYKVLLSAERRMWRVEVMLTAARLAWDIGSVLTLDFARLMSAPLHLLVVGIELALARGRMVLTLWG